MAAKFGRLKLYGTIFGVVAVVFGLKSLYDTITSEKEAFKITLDEVEKSGLGNHKYVKITGAYAPGPFVYEYKTKYGVKGNVDHIIYPVVSLNKLSDYISSGASAKLKAKVIVKMDTSFPVSRVNSFEFDSSAVELEGMVRSGFEGMSDEDKKLLKGDALDLDENFIYLVKEKPMGYGVSFGSTGLGIVILFLIFGNPMKKKEDNPVAPAPVTDEVRNLDTEVRKPD
jgi:hypothetical protein